MAARRRIPQNSAEYARWLADEISRRYRETWFARDTTMFVAMALEGYADWLDSNAMTKLTFTVTAIDEFEHGRVIAAKLDDLPAGVVQIRIHKRGRRIEEIIAVRRQRTFLAIGLLGDHRADENIYQAVGKQMPRAEQCFNVIVVDAREDIANMYVRHRW